MTCCNWCFEVKLGKRSSREVQGHHLCTPPSEAQAALFAYGERPLFEDNRWYCREAISAVIAGGIQIWFYNADHFKVIDGEAVAVDSPEY